MKKKRIFFSLSCFSSSERILSNSKKGKQHHYNPSIKTPFFFFLKPNKMKENWRRATSLHPINPKSHLLWEANHKPEKRKRVEKWGKKIMKKPNPLSWCCCFQHLVRRLSCWWWWWWWCSFSGTVRPERWCSIAEPSFLLIPPLSLAEIRGSFTLTHLSLFLFPHCKKNSGSEALHPFWFLSSVSIPTPHNTRKQKKPIKLRFFATQKGESG